MFRAHPGPHQIRDYGTTTSNGTGDWGQLIDISIDEPNSLIDAYISTPVNAKRMLSVNDIRKIIQVTTDEIISSDKVDGLNNKSMKFVITMVHQSLCDSVRPAVSAPQMERLIIGTAEQLITHYHRSARIKARLMGRLVDDNMNEFIRRLVVQGGSVKPVVGEDNGHGERYETGCFTWFWDMFR